MTTIKFQPVETVFLIAVGLMGVFLIGFGYLQVQAWKFMNKYDLSLFQTKRSLNGKVAINHPEFKADVKRLKKLQRNFLFLWVISLLLFGLFTLTYMTFRFG